MTTSIAATVVAGTPIPHVRVDVHIDAAETAVGWTITRNGSAETVQIYVGAAGITDMSLVDNTAPLGDPVSYTLAVIYPTSSTYVTSAAVSITGTTGCYLTAPATGATIAVEISEWPSRKRTARQAVLAVLGRSDPVGLTDTYATPAGRWTLISRTDAYTASLIGVLTAQGVVVLRTQPGSSVASCTALVGDIDERRFSEAGGDQRRLVDVDVQEIAALPATALPLNATLGGLAVYHGITTLTDLALLHPSLLGLSQIETG